MKPRPQFPAPRPSRFLHPLAALRADWPLYLMEAAELAAFMLSACAFTVLLYHPISPASHLNPWLTRVFMGLAMAVTAIAIIKSPWGQRSGAHFNPAITLTFYRLGKIDAFEEDTPILTGLIARAGGAVELSPQTSVKRIPCGIAVARGNSALADAIKEAVNLLYTNGTMTRLFNTYHEGGVALSGTDPVTIDAASHKS